MSLTFTQFDATLGFATDNNNGGFIANSNVVRLGSDIYAIGVYSFDGGASDTTDPVLLKSSDNGATWAIVNQTCPLTKAYISFKGFRSKLVRTTVNTKITYIVEPNPGGVTDSTFFNKKSAHFLSTEFDPSTGNWASIVDWGFACGAPSTATGESWMVYERPDGSWIWLGLTEEGGASGRFNISIRKRDIGGSWSILGTVGNASTEYALFLGEGAMVSDGTVHAVGAFQPYSSGFGTPTSLEHFSISPADIISSRHVITATLDHNLTGGSNHNTENYTQTMDISADEKTLVVLYIPDNGNNYVFGGATPCALKVAFGDLSSDILNPPWTITTAVNSTDVGAPSGLQQAYEICGVSFGTVGIQVDEFATGPPTLIAGYVEQANDINNPSVYWFSKYGHYADNSGGNHYFRLWSSKWNGSAWSSPPTLEYQPSGWDASFPDSKINKMQLILQPHIASISVVGRYSRVSIIN